MANVITQWFKDLFAVQEEQSFVDGYLAAEARLAKGIDRREIFRELHGPALEPMTDYKQGVLKALGEDMVNFPPEKGEPE